MFSTDQIRMLEEEQASLDERYEGLLNAFVLNHSYRTPEGREHGTHGFARRIGVMRRCIQNVFRLLPFDSASVPEPDDLADASINLQAFVFNVFGSIDNLAWIGVYEKDIRTPKGKSLPRNQVGLGPSHQFVRQAFSPAFQATLTGYDSWFEHLEDYRHALAHRIPLYIPPYRITSEGGYRDLDNRMTEALRHHRFDEYKQLEAEQLALREFMPVMKHSYRENTNAVAFHPQMMADYKTVEGIALRLVAEI